MTPEAGPGRNAGQIEYWNSPAATPWIREQERLDRSFAPLTRALVDRAGAAPGERVLDVGCGCGELALLMAERVGRGGSVLALDVSGPMLALARSRERARASADAAPIAWREEDAATAPVAPPPDLLVSRFGTMFFDEPEAAFRHLHTRMREGGRLAILCWAELAGNGWAHLPMGAVADTFGPVEPTPPHAPGPFAFADRERVVALLRAAGWRDLGAERVEAAMLIGRAGPDRPALDDAVHHATAIGPVARFVRLRPETADAVRTAVRTALEPYATDAEVRLPAACWLYVGRA